MADSTSSELMRAEAAPSPGSVPTPEQLEVVDLPSAERALVIAGPGSGKTFTLLARAARIAQRDGLSPAGQLLVLSFTRAVVRELRRRGGETMGLTRLLPETFDSFAARVLRASMDERDWVGAGFDKRVELAHAQVTAGHADVVLEPYRHLLVDEIQDLVGVRASFVEALLDRVNGGFTAFGDPAQALYGYEDEAQPDRPPVFEFLGARADVRTLRLSENHRAKTDQSRIALKFGVDLAGRSLPGSVRRDLRTELMSLPTLGHVVEAGPMLRDFPGASALLCRDNATALLCDRALWETATPHVLRRPAEDRPIPGWVAVVLRGAGQRLTRTDFDSAYADIDGLNAPDPEEAWRLLRGLDPRDRDGVRIDVAARRVADRNVPYDLVDEPDSPLTVSTIHRAKGLEFDACAIVEWPGAEGGDLEARAVYVALTRARSDLFQIEAVPRTAWRRDQRAGGRWVKSDHRRWTTNGFEIRPTDCEDIDPPGTLGFHEDPTTVQHRIAADIRCGDPVTLEYVGHDAGAERFVVRHESGLVGATSARFGEEFARRVGGGRRPSAIREVFVEGFETVHGDTGAGEAAGLGDAGLWLRPRVAGLGELDWASE